MPLGSVGFRWQQKRGEWNLELKDGQDGTEIAPFFSLLEHRDGVLPVSFPDYVGAKISRREVPVGRLETERGKVPVTTVFDLQHGLTTRQFNALHMWGGLVRIVTSPGKGRFIHWNHLTGPCRRSPEWLRL